VATTSLNNIELWKFSLKNPEPPFGDPYYVLNNENIITKSDSGQAHPLLLLEENITNLINEYAVSKYEAILDRIVKLLDSEYTNSTTFISYWHQHDMSFSVYMDFPTSTKMDFLKYILPKYIEQRHMFYKKHNYSAISLQVVIDNAGHKESGNLSNKKIQAMCQTAGLTQVEDLETLSSKAFTFNIIRGDSKELLDSFCEEMSIDFKWRVNHKRKNPDFIINFDKKFFIGEAKHKKEGGGGQNDQMLELIDLISFSEKRKDFGYISFLDGLLFNKFSDVHAETEKKILANKKSNKIDTQYKSITTNLSKNPNNYFLNTKGLELFLKTQVSN
jgi:hypothetical protein